MKITLGKNNNKKNNKKSKVNDVELDTQSVFCDKVQNLASEICSLDDKKEIIEMRTENCKFFAVDGDTTVAEFYGKDVHYYDYKTDSYLDIDNTVKTVGDKFVADNGKFKVQFNRQPKEGKIYTIKKEYSNVTLISYDVVKMNFCQLEKVEIGGIENNSVIIKGLKDGSVDLEYIVEHNRVKENIIVNQKSDSYEYQFELVLENVYARASKDGKQLELRNKGTSEIEFIIPSPFMVDDIGDWSDAVYYEIEELKQDVLSVKIVADKEWINDESRIFPVAIDPAVVVTGIAGVYDQAVVEPGVPADPVNPVPPVNPTNPVSAHGQTTISQGFIMNSFRKYADGTVSPTGSTAIQVASGVNGLSGHNRIEGTLTINKSMLPNHAVDNILSAQLQLTVSAMPERGSFSVNGNIFDFRANPVPSTISVDITNMIHSHSNVAIIPFTPHFYGVGNLDRVNVVLNSPRLEIRFMNSIREIEIIKPLNLHTREYWPGDSFDPTGLQIGATYNNGQRAPWIPVMASIGDNADFIFTPATLASHDTGVTITHRGKSAFLDFATAGIKIHKGFNDRRPDKRRKNVYRAFPFNSQSNEDIEADPTFYRLELADGVPAGSYDAGTPLNAKELNNILVRGENIRGKISKDNLPDDLVSLLGDDNVVKAMIFKLASAAGDGNDSLALPISADMIGSFRLAWIIYRDSSGFIGNAMHGFSRHVSVHDVQMSNGVTVRFNWTDNREGLTATTSATDRTFWTVQVLAIGESE